MTFAKAAFLDRDGVINIDNGYVSKWEDFEFLEGAISAMKQLHQAGYLLFVVTNQSGIARGYFSLDDFNELTLKMVETLAKAGVPVKKVYFCPHHKNGNVVKFSIECCCRKPAPGLLLRAQEEFNIDMGNSVMFGDKYSDYDAANRAGVENIYLIESAYTSEKKRFQEQMLFDSLSACVIKFLD
ncbi:D-glycero-beta-D-manno-heptose 1,7-bisphosphate 7-phosphatase [Amylibacter sp.]|nr:D-glycero-beta-D-manno-heptose 1,7-bisphosphate 7-phosphatase [Amylibacter sp.]